MSTPSACGTYAIQTEIIPLVGRRPGQLPRANFTIDQNCDTGGFKPRLAAGVANPVAGDFSPFTLQVTRQPGEQNISRVDTTLPEGLLGKLAGVPLCGDARRPAGDCPAASQVGSTIVGGGSRAPTPSTSPSRAGRRPRSTSAAHIRARRTRWSSRSRPRPAPSTSATWSCSNSLNIDPITTQVTAKSDPLPQFLEGIPVAYRDIRVQIDRPGFVINPTDCRATRVASLDRLDRRRHRQSVIPLPGRRMRRAGLRSEAGAEPDRPTHRSAYPKLRAVLTARKGDANIGRAAVDPAEDRVPRERPHPDHLHQVQFAANACPAKSVYGFAKAWSPLIDKPVEGPVYLRSSNHELPDLVASLKGQIDVDLAGRIDSVDARIRNTFDFVPDAPVSKFVLTMQGGKKGLLVNNTELCKAKPRASVELEGQNGKSMVASPLVKADCGKARKGKKRN